MSSDKPMPPFIDAHHHLWDFEALRYPWLQTRPAPELVCGNVEPIAQTYTVDEFRADVGQLPLVGSVHVEAGCKTGTLAETEWLAASHAEHGLPSCLVAHVDLTAADAASMLEQLADYEVVTAVRDIVAWHPDPVRSQVSRADLLDDPRWLRNLHHVENHRLVFDLQLYPHQAESAASVIGAHDELLFALEHALMPADLADRSDADSFARWRDAVHLLSSFPNAYMKISGLGMCLHDASSMRWAELVETLVDAFGAERCMFGSNYPVDGLFLSYRQVWETYAASVCDESEDVIEQLFRRTAAAVYGVTCSTTPNGGPHE